MNSRLLRKKAGKSMADTKAFSSIIGTIFMVLIIILLSSGVFLWTLSQNSLYHQSMIENKQIEIDRLNELVVAKDAVYSVSGDEVTVEAVLVNEGSITVQMVSFWIEARRGNVSIGYNFKDNLNLVLGPGNVTTLNRTNNNEITVTIQGISSSDIFVSRFVTARGNIVGLQGKYDVYDLLSELISMGGVGPMIYNFFEFRYYTYRSLTRLHSYPAGISSFQVPNDTPIAFGITLTNLDPNKRNMTLSAYTHLWVSSDSASMNQWKRFYIVNVAGDGTIASTYTEVVIPYGEKRLIVMASSQSGSFQRDSLPGAFFPDNTVQGTYLLIYGFFEGESFAQNVPFVAFFMT